MGKMWEKYLIGLPIFVFALFTSFGLIQYNTMNLSAIECVSCPESLPTCSQMGEPVLGGLDIIPYFYNESYVGERGSDEIVSVYDGFKYLFYNEDHKILFDSDPEQYIPQYGGYCAWGIGGEYCPEYPWSTSCLGPSGNWEHGTVIGEKLYFFLYSEAKEKFMANVEETIESGDERWLTWFSDSAAHMNTECFVQSTD
jgi:YHS domain-containing protein